MTCTSRRTERRTRPRARCNDFVHSSSAGALWRMLTTFPSSASFGHPLSSVRDDRGRIPAKGHGPTEVLVPTTPREERRLPEDRDAFHRHDTRGSHFCRRDCSLRPHAGISLTPPTLCSQVGDSAFVGPCKARMRSPASVRAIRECRRLFDSLELPRLGLTTQARHRARPTRPSTRTDCLARTDADRSA